MSLPAKEHWLLATTSSRQRGMKQIFPSYPLEETNTAEALILDSGLQNVRGQNYFLSQ